MRRRYLALDIGGVCIDLHPERCFSALGFPAGSSIPNEVLKAIDGIERGLIMEEKWLSVMRSHCGDRLGELEIIYAWNSILGEEKAGIYEILRKAVDNGIRIIFFSDTSAVHIAHAFRYMRIPLLTTGAVFSFRTGAKKPEKEMFMAFENIYGKPILYVDDRQENVDAGRKFGWPSFRFSCIEDLEAEIDNIIAQ